MTEANPALASRLVTPKNALAQDSVPPEIAYQLIHDELLLDGSARLNLATFVTTWMEPQARVLMAECVDKNMIDKDEYPQTAELEKRCVAILADLWHAPDPSETMGCSTTGSSEAAMLAGMALKRRWAKRVDDRKRTPNLVMGANVQVCWEKFCRYWEVEPRLVPMEGDRFHLDAMSMLPYCDEDTIGVVAVLGSTFDGSYEPVADIVAALDRLASDGGPDIPVHVDGASGAMIAPFLDRDLVWDFTLPRVASINTSGHKYGLVYPGVGWVLWRTSSLLPEELIFKVNYLGGEMPTFALNFSRPGAEVVAQYYNFFRLGWSGFTAVQQANRDVATWLANQIEATGRFRLITRGDNIPVFAFTTTAPADSGSRSDPESGARFDAHGESSGTSAAGWDVYALSRALRERGWQVPAYSFPENRTDLSVLRIVVRNGFSHSLAASFFDDLQAGVAQLDEEAKGHSVTAPAGFHH